MDAVKLAAKYLTDRDALPLQLAIDLAALGHAVKLERRYSGESDNRDRYEQRVADVVTGVFFETELDPTDPQSAENLRDELTVALLLLLASVYVDYVGELATVTGVAVDLAVLQAQARLWAQTYVPGIVSGIVDTTRDNITQIIRLRTTGELTADQIAAELDTLLSAARAQLIAATETTAAMSAGVDWYVTHLAATYGITSQLAWFTERDDRVCPICAPRHGKLRGDGWQDNPPAHPNCRCWLDIRVSVL